MKEKYEGFRHVTARQLARETSSLLDSLSREGPIVVWRYGHAAATIHPCSESATFRPRPSGHVGEPPEEIRTSVLYHLGEKTSFDEACMIVGLSPLQAAVVAARLELDGLIEGAFGCYRLTPKGRKQSDSIIANEYMEAGEEPPTRLDI